jgi:hypothetical protein
MRTIRRTALVLGAMGCVVAVLWLLGVISPNVFAAGTQPGSTMQLRPSTRPALPTALTHGLKASAAETPEVVYIPLNRECYAVAQDCVRQVLKDTGSKTEALTSSVDACIAGKNAQCGSHSFCQWGNERLYLDATFPDTGQVISLLFKCNGQAASTEPISKVVESGCVETTFPFEWQVNFDQQHPFKIRWCQSKTIIAHADPLVTASAMGNLLGCYAIGTMVMGGSMPLTGITPHCFNITGLPPSMTSPSQDCYSSLTATATTCTISGTLMP